MMDKTKGWRANMRISHDGARFVVEPDTKEMEDHLKELVALRCHVQIVRASSEANQLQASDPSRPKVESA